jgi:hypothetical protein
MQRSFYLDRAGWVNWARCVPVRHRVLRRCNCPSREFYPSQGVVTLTSLGRIEANSATWQLQAATFHSAMALRR